MKKIFFVLALLALGVLANEVTVVRATTFYVECTSLEEKKLIRSRAARNLSDQELASFVDEKLSCIEGKQTALERFIFRATGKSLIF